MISVTQCVLETEIKRGISEERSNAQETLANLGHNTNGVLY